MNAQSNIRLILQPHIGYRNPATFGLAQGGFCLRGGWDAEVYPGLRSGREVGQSHRWKGCRYI